MRSWTVEITADGWDASTKDQLRITMWLAPPRACGALRSTRRVSYGKAWTVKTRLDGTWLTSARAWRRVANL
jgi:hypothetical protein